MSGGEDIVPVEMPLQMQQQQQQTTQQTQQQQQMQQQDDTVQPPALPKLSESFQVALDVLKRSKDVEKKVGQALPGALAKLKDAETDDEKSEANAIIQTLAQDENSEVRVAVARMIPLWADVEPELAGKVAYSMAAQGDRDVGMSLAEGMFAWLDKSPDMAGNVAKKLSKNKGMGVNLVLADSLPMWAEHHADLTGKIAKKIAKNYNHYNAVTHLLEKTYGENWRENIETIAGESAAGEEQKRALIGKLFFKAGEHVQQVKVSLASGLSDWAGFNPDAAEEVVQMLVDDIVESKNHALNRAVNTALFTSLEQLAPDHPKTTARLAAVLAQNPDQEVSDHLVLLMKNNLNVDPNAAKDVAMQIDGHPAQNNLRILSRFFDNEGEDNLLDQLGI